MASDRVAPPGSADRPPVVRTLAYVVIGAALLGRFGGPLSGLASALGTGAHEAGHALFADVLAGDVASITVFPDGGGVTFSQVAPSRFRSFLVAGAGYPATLVAALALLTAVFFGRSARPAAIAAGVIAGSTLVFWTPFSPAFPGIDTGDQRFTWFVFAAATVVFGALAALPDRHDHARRIALGVLAAGLLTDALGAGRDLVLIEGRFGEVTTDADALAEASGLLSSSSWAWLIRGALFLIGGAWAWVVVRVAAATPTRT